MTVGRKRQSGSRNRQGIADGHGTLAIVASTTTTDHVRNGKAGGNTPVKEPTIPSPDFLIKTGDSAPRINATLQNSGGTAVNIQGATVVFKAAPISGGTTVVAGTVTIDQNGDGSDGTLGMVHYNWASADTRSAGAGLFCAEFETVFTAGGGTETFPNDGYILIGITADL